MKIPVWKKWLSYLKEIQLEHRSSIDNENLIVCLTQGRLQLCTENAIYSFADKYDNFYNIFKQINWDYNFEEILILGFGLGSIPYMLENNFKKRMNYTGIEIDAEVIDLASKYVVQYLQSPISLVQADAAVFTELTNETYDMICVDVFIDDMIPPKFRTEEFLSLLQTRLNKNGVILYNMLALHEQDKKASQLFFNKHFSRVYPNSALVDVGTNYILVNDRAYMSKKR